MDTLVLSAPAKVNLGLWVGRKRADGFHEIVTIIAPVELADTLRISTARYGIEVACDSADVPTDAGNLAWLAAAAFSAAVGTNVNCRIHITKRIPVGGGLGGGSSNAATVLAGLNRLFGRPLSPRRLRLIGAFLGSDVPAFLLGGPCIARGRGERIRRIRLPRLDLLLCFPGHPVSTAWAYAALDRSRASDARPAAQERASGFRIPAGIPRVRRAGPRLTSDTISPKILRASLKRNESDRVAAQLANSFEPVVFKRHPALGRAKELLLKHGALAASLSGSGSTVYGLVGTKGWKDPMAALARLGFHCVRTRTI